MRYFWDSDELTIYTGMRDVVLVGGAIFEEQLIPIYVRTTTGDVLYMHPVDESGMCVSELCVCDPLEIKTCRDAVLSVVKESSGAYIGVIYTKRGRYLITPDFEHCQLVSFLDTKPLEPLVDIDPNVEDALDSREG